MSATIDIDIHRELFVHLIITISMGRSKSLLWLGYDSGITDVEIGNYCHKQVTLRNPVEAVFMLIHPIFMAYGLKGRGTRIWLVEDQEHHYHVLKDCWLPQGWANNSILHRLLQNESHEDPQFSVEVRSPQDEGIVGDQDKYHIFDDPLFGETNYPSGLAGIPTLLYWDEVQCLDGAGSLVPETT